LNGTVNRADENRPMIFSFAVFPSSGGLQSLTGNLHPLPAIGCRTSDESVAVQSIKSALKTTICRPLVVGTFCAGNLSEGRVWQRRPGQTKSTIL